MLCAGSCGQHLTGAMGVPWRGGELRGLPGGEDATGRARRPLHCGSVKERIQAEDKAHAKVWGLKGAWGLERTARPVSQIYVGMAKLK